MRALLFVFLLALCSCATSKTAHQDHFSPRLLGQWVGTLQYKDYQDPTRQVKLPTVLKATSTATTGVVLHYTYDDGPGKTVESTSVFSLDVQDGQLSWGAQKESRDQRSIFKVQDLTCGEDEVTCRLIVETEGEDDNKPATIRETVIVGGMLLIISKEVRFRGEKDFIVRHEYSFKRQP